MRTLPISRYRQQQAFKAVYEVCQGTEHCSDTVSRFSRTVLWIMDWYKNKVMSAHDEKDPFNKQLLEYLDQFPEKEEYEKFDPLSVEDIRPDESETLRICSYSEDNDGEKVMYWVMQSTEPVPDTAITLITDISIYGTADKLIMGIRGIKRCPYNSKDDCIYYRPAFLRNIIKWDGKYIKLVGEGADKKYSFSDKAVHINGKSRSECDEFITGFIENPGRQFPVFLISDEQYIQLGEESSYYEKEAENESEDSSEEEKTENPESDQDDKVAENNDPENDKPEPDKKGRMIIDAAAEALLGYAYLFVVDGSARKIFSREGYFEYIDDLANGEIMYSANSGKPAVFETVQESRSEGFFAIDKNFYFTGSILDSQRNRMEQSVFDFGDLLFYQELWLKKRDEDLRKLLSGDDRNPDLLIKTIEELRNTVQDLKEESKEKTDELQRSNDRLKKENDSLKSENRKLDNYSKSLKQSKDELKIINQELTESAEAAKQQENIPVITGMSQKEYTEKYKGLINPPARYIKDEIPDWIRKYYSETLILHPRAEKSLMDADRPEESMRILVAMIHYLHGCTLFWNEGGRGFDQDKKIHEEYVLDKYRLEICDSSDKTLKEKDNLKKYSIDIGSYYKDAQDRGIIEEKKRSPVVCIGQHVKYGVGYGDEPSMVRLYYYYDSDLKKSIIGYMPGHLPTFSG